VGAACIGVDTPPHLPYNRTRWRMRRDESRRSIGGRDGWSRMAWLRNHLGSQLKAGIAAEGEYGRGIWNALRLSGSDCKVC
jgi:hypothetical protein